MNIPKITSDLEQDRILFTSLKNSSIFFDCHPAEARSAIKHIEELRSMGLAKSLKEEIDKVRYYCIKQNNERQIEEIDKNKKLTISLLNDSFSEMEKNNLTVKYIVLKAERYADIRGFGKSIYDEPTLNEIRCGLFGNIWTGSIVVCQDLNCINGFYLVSDEELVLSINEEEKTAKNEVKKLKDFQSKYFEL